MANLPFIAAIDEGIHQEMARDSSVLYFGQNLATTENHEFVKRYGHDRVRVTPISETAEIGIGVGAAMAGLRPVIELYMAEFMLVAMDQVVNEAAKFRYMTGGQVKVPLVLKAGYGFTAGWAGQHTGSLAALFMGWPGFEVRHPLDGGGREGPRWRPRFAMTIRWCSCTTTCSRSSTAKCRMASISCRSARRKSAAPART